MLSARHLHLALAAMVLGITSLTAAPKAKPAAPPPPKAKVVADKLTAEEEPSPVPDAGPLNLVQLIDLAIFNHPKTLEARRKLEVARARRLAATDLRDPELRFSYSTQTDVEVGDPYFESSLSRSGIDGTEDSHSSRFGTGLEAGNNRFDYESLRFHETRLKRIEQEVIPGATRDKIITREFEVRQSNDSGHHSRNDLNTTAGSSRQRDYNFNGGKHLRQVSKTTTYVNHRDVTQGSTSMGLLLRFPFPNLFEMHAKVQEANAEIAAADYNGKALENEIIIDLRGLYEDLAYQEALQDSLAKLSAQRQEWSDFARTGALDKLASAAGNSTETRQAILESRMKAASLRSQIAQLAGLADPSRIAVTKDFRHRHLDLSALNEDYLIQMASVFRADLHFLMAKNDSARAAYRKERAALIPMAAFFDVGVGYQDDYRGRDSTEFTARVGVTIPLWSWLINDADKVPAAEARALSREIGRLHGNIETQVKTALQLIRLSQQTLAESEKEFAALQILMKNEALGGAGLSKNPQEIISESQEIMTKLNIERLKLHRANNQAVLTLEQALGTRLEKVLPPTSGK